MPFQSRTHGHTVSGKNGKPTPEYRAYQAAKSRCTNPKVRNYKAVNTKVIPCVR
jgi:hypothetical protein